MGRAWISGFSAVFLAHLAWFGVIVGASRVDGFMPLIVILLPVVLNIAGLAAFLIARQRAPHRFLLALTMAPVTAVLGTASNLLFRMAGSRVDISGFYNDAGLFTSLLAYGVLVCVVGALIGLWVSRKSREEVPAVSALPSVPGETLPAMVVSPAPGPADLPQIRSD
jgi:hypothetical protein